MSKRLAAAGFILRMSGLAVPRARTGEARHDGTLREECELTCGAPAWKYLLAGGSKGGGMSIIRKYGFVLVLMLAVIYVYAPLSLEYVAKLPWLDDVNVILNKSLAYTKREVGTSPVDPIAAANVDEDLDYRIAQRMKSTEGWRSFLTVHPEGPHAQPARAELESAGGCAGPHTGCCSSLGC